jgi:hypothetical protein
MMFHELQEQALKLPVKERWQLIHALMRSVLDQQSWPLQPYPEPTSKP